MTRLRVDRTAVTGHLDCLSIAKGIMALLVSFSLMTTPVWAAPASSLGTVVYADRALVGTAPASVGATIFAGDRLSTDPSGSVQVRAGAARLLLSSASTVTFSQHDPSPAPTLTNALGLSRPPIRGALPCTWALPLFPPKHVSPPPAE